MRTVFWLRKSFAAISAFVLPLSQELEDLELAVGELRKRLARVRHRRAARKRRSRSATAGPKIASPFATERIARSVSFWAAPFN